jgi:rubrerythrin
MIPAQLKELLLQSLEHEKGGVLVYQTALECVLNEDLEEEWEEYLSQTEDHVEVLTSLCTSLGLDPNERTPGCQVVQHTGKSLIQAMKMALAASNPSAAQLVACECVVLAETKDHANWELIGACAEAYDDPTAKALRAAYETVEDEEDEHLYHTMGWCRELWLQSLGIDATLPPPEEERDAKSAVEADNAKKSEKPRRKESETEAEPA